MLTTNQNLTVALKEYFGFDRFKGDQEAIVNNVLNRKDTFVIMPTGAGKSLCYQLPALMMEGTAIVISPLIALMKNQVDSIRSYHEYDDVAHFLNSSLTKVQIRKVKEDIQSGKTKLLYIAPETLTKEENLEFFAQNPISFVAVDEAHCISEWGHDFRPEYRRIKTMIDMIGEKIPVIALTATATPKVRVDIVKNLNMEGETVFMSSFNREKLYYEVRAKEGKQEALKNMVRIIKEIDGSSGIIYVQSRKTTEEIAEFLSVNGIKAAPYHAGLDAKTRAATQDAFLMQDVEVIVATIAFGMGIDKPDIRFVIHYDMPKSIENYYQETGRAGRDGLGASCVAFYSHRDLQKLEKFLRDKSVAEREMAYLLMGEVAAYAETAACRRQFLLHYFGENFECDRRGLCDNCRYPRETEDVSDELVMALKSIITLNENLNIQNLVRFIVGEKTKTNVDFGYDKMEHFGKGAYRDERFWNSVFRNALLSNLIRKDIEQYGLIKITDQGKKYLESPQPFEIALNNDFSKQVVRQEHVQEKPSALDPVLLKLLKDLRKKVSKAKNVPPFVIFQDPSLEDMCIQYPVSMDDMANITGVSKGKALKYARPFIDLIKEYVDENDIDRPSDFVVKTVANKSKTKIHIISSIDRKIPLDDIARTSSLNRDELMHELYMIVTSGTKVDLRYHVDEHIDEYAQEVITDYFMAAENDSVDDAYRALKDDDITLEEIEVMRLKFLSEMAN